MMYSIRKIGLMTIGMGLVSGMLFTTGCANIHDNPPMVLNDQPLKIDEAMQARDWPPTLAVYANGSVVAPPTYFPYYAKASTTGWLVPFVDAGLFAGQTVALPVTFFLADNPQVYSGVIVPPTYTAVPPAETVP